MLWYLATKGFHGGQTAFNWVYLVMYRARTVQDYQAAVLLMLDPKTPFQAVAIFLGGVAVSP